MHFKILSLFVFVVLFSACEEVIELELENDEPQLVIEATINVNTQTAVILLTQSNGFYDEVDLNTVSDATVRLSLEDETDLDVPLVQDGLYILGNLNVIEGEVLTLNVTDSEGIIYQAQASVPHSVQIDSLEFIEANFGGPGGGNTDVQQYQIFTHWQDVPNKASYYRTKPFVNGDAIAGNYTLADDLNRDGGTITLPFFNTFSGGDTVRVQLLSMNENSFEYFNELAAVQSQGFNSTTPFNPAPIFSNEALGYFGIFNIDEQAIILPK